MPRTRRADTTAPGITRKRRGRGFAYLDAAGSAIADEETIARIRALAIPPAWTDVWICTDPRGHIQATGTDAAGRKQYRYHDDWRARRDAAKFDAMIEFAEALPVLRRRVARDLRRDELDSRRVNACAVRMLDIGFFRIGSEDYAERNGSYGLTTLRRAHVHVRGDSVTFDYPAKHGVRRVQAVADAEVREIVCSLKRRRGGGDELLAYREGRRWLDIKADDVNAYLKQATGGDFTAKDFRTWNATALCAVVLARHAAEASSPTARKRQVSAAVKEVARYLGNTPAVCRKSYIDPRVIDRFDSGLTIAGSLASLPAAGEAGDAVDEHSVTERVRGAVLDLIAGDRGSPMVERIAA